MQQQVQQTIQELSQMQVRVIVLPISKELAESILNDYKPTIKAFSINDVKRALPQFILDKIDTMEMVKHITLSGKVQRTVVINMLNGESVTGEPSVSESVANDKEVINIRLALENAISKLLPFENYLQSQEAYQASKNT